MSLSEIFSDSLKYPFSDVKTFLIIGVLCILANIGGIINSYGYAFGFGGIISLIVNIVIIGYMITVVAKSINKDDALPELDFGKNIILGIKSYIVSFVYLIIPAIIVIILAFIAIGPLASSIMSNNMAQVAITSGNATMFIQQIPAETLSTSLASMGIVVIIAIILAIIFGIFAIIGLCRLAKSESIGDALSFGKVWEDIRNIGILKIIGYLILLWILLFLISIVIGIISIIPFVGAIIAALILYPYMTFLIYRSLGLLYSDA